MVYKLILIVFLSFLKQGHAQPPAMDPEKVKLYKQIGLSNFFEYNYESAVQKLSAVIRSSPNDAEALYYRALSKIELGDAKSAVGDLNKCMILEEENANYAFKLSDVHLLLGSYEKAVKSYDKAIKVVEAYPTDENKKILGGIYYQRAYANSKLSNTIGACEDLNKAVELHFPEALKVQKKFCK